MMPAMSRYDDLLRTGGALAGPVGAAALDELARDGAPQVGDLVGPFRIVREFGRGGMALVFMAERADGQFRQQVALKWILPLAATPAAREMFRRERQILADLSHPNIARLVDGGETPDGQLWFAMQWIGGEPVDHWCASRGVGVAGRVRLILEIADALRFAHVRSLLHCDVKAANVLVDTDGAAHLIDFGVARLTVVSDAAPVHACTPAFASPEQRHGLAVGTGSDIYQLGLLLAHLLGASDTPIVDHRSANTDAPDRRFEWPLDCPPELRAIALRATRRDPTRRYDSVCALADDCMAWLERRPVRAFRNTTGYRLRCLARRNPATTAVVIGAVVAVLALATMFALRLAAERNQARAAATRAEAVSGFLVRLFRDVDPAANRVAADVARNLVHRGETVLTQELSETPDVRAAVFATLAEVNHSLGDYAGAQRLARSSLDEAADLSASDRARRRALLARAQASGGDYDLALATCAAALASADPRRVPAETRALLLGVQANAAQLRGDHALAIASARSVLVLAVQGTQGAELSGMAHLTLANVAEQRGDMAAALVESERSRVQLTAALGPAHARLATLEAYRAYLLLGTGRPDLALAAADAAVEGLQRTYGDRHVRLSYALTNRALALSRLGRADEARTSGARALSMCVQLLGPDNAQCAVSAQVQATILQGVGEYAKALPLLEDVLRIRQAALAADHPYVGYAELLLADALCRNGSTRSAREHADKAETILTRQRMSPEELSILERVRLDCGSSDRL